MPKPDPIKLAQSIRKNAPSFESEGRKYFVVEHDLQIEEGQLLNYCKEMLAKPVAVSAAAKGDDPLGLVVATIDGKPMRWKPGTVLTWFVEPGTFPKPQWAKMAKEYVQKATDDWNAASKKAKLKISFLKSTTPADAVIRIRFENFSQAGLIAVAFFPNDPAYKRFVRVGPTLFDKTSGYDPVGVLRHELGHVLGFRHEHIRPEAPQQIEAWAIGSMGAEELTQYDPKSLMHYPMTPGYGTKDFQITKNDHKGFALLYRMNAAEVREFSP